jgi:hypothetical protein
MKSIRDLRNSSTHLSSYSAENISIQLLAKLEMDFPLLKMTNHNTIFKRYERPNTYIFSINLITNFS